MPLNGNRLGEKTAVVYTSDAAIAINLKIDADLVITNAGLTAGTTGTSKPSRFKPRGVHAQFIDAGKIYRKFFVCGTTAATLYATNTPTTVTCDGAAFITTGRRGEKQTF